MKTKYVLIETPNYNGKKVAPAQIWKTFSTRQSAENFAPIGCYVYTQVQAEKIIEKWNSEFEQGNKKL